MTTMAMCLGLLPFLSIPGCPLQFTLLAALLNVSRSGPCPWPGFSCRLGSGCPVPAPGDDRSADDSGPDWSGAHVLFSSPATPPSLIATPQAATGALPCPALVCSALPCPGLLCPALPWSALPCPALVCPALLACSALPCLALPSPTRSILSRRLARPFPALSVCSALPYPALFCSATPQ